MKGLLIRLSGTDTEAQAALRVIEYFDALTVGQATVEALVRGTAALAECPAGIGVPGRPPLRFDAAGERRHGPVPEPSSQVDLGDGGAVWLERDGGPGPLDELIVERMAVAARALLPAEEPRTRPSLADVALVETVLSEREPPEERTKALRRLGLVPGGPLVVIVVAPAQPDADPAGSAIALLSRTRTARAAHIAAIDRAAAVLVQTADRDGLRDRLAVIARECLGDPGGPGAVRVGIGRRTAAMDAHESWASALLALRFADASTPEDAVADVERLGTTVVLAGVPAAQWRSDRHVQHLQALARGRGGGVDLEVLDAFLRTGSLRQAATLLHMHHSSVASRLARIEQRTGWSFASCDDVFQARLALVGLRLLGAEGEHPAGPRR